MLCAQKGNSWKRYFSRDHGGTLFCHQVRLGGNTVAQADRLLGDGQGVGDTDTLKKMEMYLLESAIR